jgi:hypothetical protein
MGITFSTMMQNPCQKAFVFRVPYLMAAAWAWLRATWKMAIASHQNQSSLLLGQDPPKGCNAVLRWHSLLGWAGLLYLDGTVVSA